ncbi:hypothetical protein EW093_04435 [Thiospirochaeta perfilievii]|uniref:AMP-activated protein kinase glycogen-binding domain-containing protein n=1 Tax=Thiospirochaeta perfilievii TaxID=252967 RepID=A0A5C1Q9F1_9SPIO|nr:glycogen-binding domain-containing protein [Thiospirochaeta perfilievii]QEN03978.1 hypothetical protein EW093_04435 [Thiospirochaeta perfilievii]
MKKRFLITMIIMFFVTLNNFADVAVKDIDGTNVEIIITHKDDELTELNVIGSFNNWIEPGTPMEKGENGLWELRFNANIEDEIVYKFFLDGNYIPDENAPDTKDDGFAGFNGLIIVSDLLTQQAASEAVAAGEKPAPVEYKSKLNFGMYTIVGAKSTFVTQGLVDKTVKGLETDTAGLSGKSYWKMGGTIVPDVNAWFELKVFDSYQPFWAQDATGLVSPDLETGLASSLGGLLINPVNYIGGDNPSLNSVKFGIESEVVNWETGYGYAKPQGRTALLWETLGEKDGNNGYMRFDLGSKYEQMGPAKIELTVMPNVMTENYALLSFLGATIGKTKIDFQYDMKSAATNDLSAIFDKLYHQDFIFGVSTKVGKYDLTAQSMINLFSEEDFNIKDQLAGEVKISGALGSKLGTHIGYRYTGSSSEMLFGNNDSIGDKGTQRISAELYSKGIKNLKVGLYSSLILAETRSTDVFDQLYFYPYTDIDLPSLDGTLKFNGKFSYTLEDNWIYKASKEKYLFSEFGANLNINNPTDNIDNIDFKYGLNNHDEDKIFNTLITSLRMPNNLTAEIGLGVRTVKESASQSIKDENNLIGFSVGGSWKVPVRKIKSPLLYGAFVYNMDPYDDESNNLAMDGYTTTDGVSKSDGYAQFRIMMKWDF